MPMNQLILSEIEIIHFLQSYLKAAGGGCPFESGTPLTLTHREGSPKALPAVTHACSHFKPYFCAEELYWLCKFTER